MKDEQDAQKVETEIIDIKQILIIFSKSES